MLERQEIIKSLVDKVIVYADGNITIEGLIVVSDFVTPVAESVRCS